MPFAPMAAINAVMAVAGLAPDGTPEPMRVSESWFPIASAPEGVCVEVRYLAGTSFAPVHGSGIGVKQPNGRWCNDIDGAGYIYPPDEWRLLPEQT